MNRRLAAGLLTFAAAVTPIAAQTRDKNPVVVMDTSMGKITIELFADKAPLTVKNFLQYADDRFYDGTIFHRVIANFMVQGGGFEPDSLAREKKTLPPIKNESANGLSNERGTIAMARLGPRNETQEEIQKAGDSATSQFFINVKDNPRLDRARFDDGIGYCVFGRVIDGMDVVDKIRQVETGTRDGHRDVPVKDVLIRSVRRK